LFCQARLPSTFRNRTRSNCNGIIITNQLEFERAIVLKVQNNPPAPAHGLANAHMHGPARSVQTRPPELPTTSPLNIARTHMGYHMHDWRCCKCKRAAHRVAAVTCPVAHTRRLAIQRSTCPHVYLNEKPITGKTTFDILVTSTLHSPPVTSTAHMLTFTTP